MQMWHYSMLVLSLITRTNYCSTFSLQLFKISFYKNIKKLNAETLFNQALTFISYTREIKLESKLIFTNTVCFPLFVIWEWKNGFLSVMNCWIQAQFTSGTSTTIQPTGGCLATRCYQICSEILFLTIQPTLIHARFLKLVVTQVF